MEREVGGGIGMGNTCKPMAVSFQCMTKFTTNKKKIKKIKKKKDMHSFFCITYRIIEYAMCYARQFSRGQGSNGEQSRCCVCLHGA